MPEPNAPAETPAAEPSISDLRKMFASDTPAPEPAAAAAEPPAPEKPSEKPAPDPDPETAKQAAGQDRDETGKFKAKEDTPEPADTPGVAKRIGKLLAEKRAAEQRAEDAERRLAPGSQPAKEQAQPPAAPQPQMGKPVSASFETYEAYVEALTDWKVEQSNAARSQREAAQKTAENWKTRSADARTAHPDYDQVLAEAESTPISRAMHETIAESDLGPELVYFLAKNPDDAARIAKLPPLAAAREIGKLEATLSAKPEKPAAAAPAKPLPKPPKAVGGGHAPAAIDLNDPDLSMKDFKREAARLLAA